MAGRASRQTPPTSRSSPVIGWGFEVGSQRQYYPHYRFQITIDNVCGQKGNVCPSVMTYTCTVSATYGINMGLQLYNREHFYFLKIAPTMRWNKVSQSTWYVCVGTPALEMKRKSEKTLNFLGFTSCGYVWHAYVSGGNELQDLLHILPALLFVLWSNIHPFQRFPCCQCEWIWGERKKREFLKIDDAPRG